MSDIDVAELRRLLAKRTPGRWRLWGMDIMAGPEDSANYDDAVLVAVTYSPERAKLRTFNADLMASLVNAAPELLDVYERRAEVPIFYCTTHLCGSCAGCKAAHIRDENSELRAKVAAARALVGEWSVDRSDDPNDPSPDSGYFADALFEALGGSND